VRNIWKAVLVLGVLAYLFYPSGWDDFLGYAVGIGLVVVIIVGIINGTLGDSCKSLITWLGK